MKHLKGDCEFDWLGLRVKQPPQRSTNRVWYTTGMYYVTAKQ